MNINDLTGIIIGSAITVHRSLGPGLLESAYEVCLVHELKKSGVNVRRQVSLPVIYDGIKLEAGFLMDLLVEDLVVVELKSVSALLPIHEAQLLTYLRLAKKQIGLLINFNEVVLKNGIKRRINSQVD
jgi:GxxExxY protein